MNFSGFMIKLNSFISSGATRLTSLLGAESKVQNTIETTSVVSGALSGFFNFVIDLVCRIIYVACQFVLNVIELIELTINRILGITINLSDYAVIDRSNPLFKILTSEGFVKVFGYVVGVGIVLVIVFTIFAIIRSEYAFATDDGQTANSKGGIFKRTFKSLFLMGFFPLVIMASIILVNAILAGFNNILRNGEQTTMSAQVFAASAYNANNYRNYADANVRIPIVINFDDPVQSGQAVGYSKAELAKIYKTFEKQGKALYDNFADNNFDSFGETLTYKNNRLYNVNDYSGFEKFVCTREQYYVLADFIDYAVKNNVKYYIKNMKDIDINWMYVDSTIYDKETQSLTITYRDASDVNGGDPYTVVYTPSSLDISTPIGDAVRTLSALLGIGEYEDNNFDVLKRLEDSINVVEWETDKVFLQLSPYYKVTDMTKENHQTAIDQLLLYEQARYEHNNTLNYSLSELESGVDDLPVYKIQKRFYQTSSGKFVTSGEYYAVKINGTYYEVELAEDLKDASGNLVRDDFGDPYYTLVNTEWDLIELIQQDAGGSYYYQVPEYEIDGSYKTDESGNTVYRTIYVNKNDAVKINNKYYYKSEDSFKDIIITVLNGTYGTELDNGLTVTSSYDDKVERVIKQTSWPKKLINDLQIIYKDINFNFLLTTGDWLTNLGEYVSGDKYSEYGSSIQTGLIHPLGLIMAEMFLGEISEADEYNLYCSLDYNSKFDGETIKAFILSMLGEDRYYQLKEELEYFIEIYNVFMGPVLDQVSYYENFDLLSGNEQSIELYTYKAYLASMLLSTNAANWFYQTAMHMLGVTDFAEDIINTETGYYKYYEAISETNKALLSNLLKNAKNDLAQQFVYPEDSTYPEYMKVLETYIKGYFDKNSDGIQDSDEDYFEGRLEQILSAVKSLEKQEAEMDTAKVALESAYSTLKTFVENNNKYAGIFNNYITAADSGYRYRSSDASATKDAFDVIYAISDASYFKDNLAVVENNVLSLMRNYNIGENDGLPAKFANYFEKANEYMSLKVDYLTEDNSSSLVGQAEALKAQRDRNLTQAGLLWDAEDSDDDLLGFSNDSDTWWALGDWDDVTPNGLNLSTMKAHVNNLKQNKDRIIETIKIRAEGTDYRSSVEESVNRYISCLQSAYEAQEKLDKLNRYEITFSVKTLISEGTSTTGESTTPLSFDVVVSNKHYSVGQNFTRAKFVEYVLGHQYLADMGLDTVFVSDDYNGLVMIEYLSFTQDEYNKLLENEDKSYTFWKNSEGNVSKFKTNSYGKVVKFIENEDGSYTQSEKGKYIEDTEYGKYLGYKPIDAFKNVRDFATEIGQISAVLYQMTNLINLSKSTVDELVLGTNANNVDLAKKVLLFLVNGEYLPTDLMKAFFDIDSSVAKEDIKTTAQEIILHYANYEKSNEKLNTVLSYLLMTEANSNKKNFIDYSKLTLKDVRKMCLSALVNFEQQEGETTEQNQKRYLAILALACSDWLVEQNYSEKYGALDGSWTSEQRIELEGRKISLALSNQSMATILRLAGLDNRPYEELVGAEYTINFDLGGVDENNGDIFIICTFDDETKTYVPFMMANKSGARDSGLKHADGANEDVDTWYEKFNYVNPYTDYYATPDNSGYIYFPIIAKGIVYSDGRPTAIREVDGNIEYYRDDVVIHDASDIGLEQYYMSMDQISVHYGLISSIANGFSKLFTGKSLVEKLVESIPRFAAHTDYNFCYGVGRTVKYTSIEGKVFLSFNFAVATDRATTYTIDCVYQMDKINILVLLIGTIGLISAIWKALWGVIGRMFDIALDVLVGPAVISTINLKYDKISGEKVEEKGFSSYEQWKDKTQNDILGVFAYAIGFNIFFIVVPIINNMVLFETNSAFASLPLVNLIPIGFLNEIARLIFLIGSAYLMRRAPALFAEITGTKDGFADGDKVLGNVKNTINELQDTISGQAFIDKMGDIKDKALNMIPGREIAKKVGQKAAGAAIFAIAVANGVPVSEANKMRKYMENNYKKQEDIKQKRRDEREARQDARWVRRGAMDSKEAEAKKKARSKREKERKDRQKADKDLKYDTTSKKRKNKKNKQKEKEDKQQKDKEQQQDERQARQYAEAVRRGVENAQEQENKNEKGEKSKDKNSASHDSEKKNDEKSSVSDKNSESASETKSGEGAADVYKEGVSTEVATSGEATAAAGEAAAAGESVVAGEGAGGVSKVAAFPKFAKELVKEDEEYRKKKLKEGDIRGAVFGQEPGAMDTVPEPGGNTGNNKQPKNKNEA